MVLPVLPVLPHMAPLNQYLVWHKKFWLAQNIWNLQKDYSFSYIWNLPCKIYELWDCLLISVFFTEPKIVLNIKTCYDLYIVSRIYNLLYIIYCAYLNKSWFILVPTWTSHKQMPTWTSHRIVPTPTSHDSNSWIAYFKMFSHLV